MLHKLAFGVSWGDDVKLTDQFPIYELGGALRHMKEIAEKGDADPYTQLFAIWEARKHVKQLVNGEPFHLNYCWTAADDVLTELTKKEEKLGAILKQEKPAPLEQYELVAIKQKIEVFEHQFSAEVRKMAAYLVPRRGIFDTEQLVDHAERHFSPQVIARIPEMAVNEFRLAGRCLAFGLYSASGYHAMRATESVLSEYYLAFKGKPERDEISMGQMAGHLDDFIKSKQTKPKPSQRTVGALKDIASFDRNPVMHPTAVLVEEDAITLFSRAQGVIIDMARELIELGDAHAQNDMLLPIEQASGPAENALMKRPARPKKGTTSEAS